MTYAFPPIAPMAAEIDRTNAFPNALWREMGDLGILGITVPEEYGGLGLDFGYNAIIDEEIGYNTDVATGFSLQSDIVANYIISYGSEEQKKQWTEAGQRTRREAGGTPSRA